MWEYEKKKTIKPTKPSNRMLKSVEESPKELIVFQEMQLEGVKSCAWQRNTSL